MPSVSKDALPGNSSLKALDGKSLSVAIQGYEGSFHQVAANQFFGKQVNVIPCATFREVIKKASNRKESDGGVMAIENSIAGSILPNYNLLLKSQLTIVGEVYLQIGQHLLVNLGVTLDDIKEVHSHPMALLQCIDYLEKFPHWKLVETEDTALSAKHLRQRHGRHSAAIASKLAAYGKQSLEAVPILGDGFFLSYWTDFNFNSEQVSFRLTTQKKIIISVKQICSIKMNCYF